MNSDSTKIEGFLDPRVLFVSVILKPQENDRKSVEEDIRRRFVVSSKSLTYSVVLRAWETPSTESTIGHAKS